MDVRKKPGRDGTLAGRGEGTGARRWSERKDQFGLGQRKQFAKPCISKPHGQLCHFFGLQLQKGRGGENKNPIERDCKSFG